MDIQAILFSMSVEWYRYFVSRLTKFLSELRKKILQ